MINQVFSFKRYVWLLKRQWYENAAIYTWGIILMVLTFFLLFCLSSSWKTVGIPHLGQMETFSITGAFFLYIYAACFFDSLSSKHKRMFYFSLPVSQLERVTVAFTYVMVLFPVLFLMIFTVFDFIAVQLFYHIHGTFVQMFFKTAAPFGTLRMMFVMLLTYLSYASVFTLGSLMFGKKGIVVSIVFCIVFFGIYVGLWKFVFNGINSTFFIDFMRNHVYVYLLPICWTAMYFVMKKKEA